MRTGLGFFLYVISLLAFFSYGAACFRLLKALDTLIRMFATIYLIAGNIYCMARYYLYCRGEASVRMRKHQRIWQYFQQHRMASIVVGHVSIVTVLGLLFLGNMMGMNIMGVFAKHTCSSGDHVHIVAGGETLDGIAVHNNTTWRRLASYNHLANPDLIYVNQLICIPGRKADPPSSSPNSPAKGNGNYFPYGQCTWWANQRFHTLHGIYVPWKTNADAWAWLHRARDFHWRVSSRPRVGDIMVLQPWVQGAYGLGHVAVVEKVLSNGNIIASSMNWGRYYWDVTDAKFSPGPGVSFVSY